MVAALPRTTRLVPSVFTPTGIPELPAPWKTLITPLAGSQEQPLGYDKIEEAILGVVGGLDKPGSPAGEAIQAFHSELKWSRQSLYGAV